MFMIEATRRGKSNEQHPHLHFINPEPISVWPACVSVSSQGQRIKAKPYQLLKRTPLRKYTGLVNIFQLCIYICKGPEINKGVAEEAESFASCRVLLKDPKYTFWGLAQACYILSKNMLHSTFSCIKSKSNAGCLDIKCGYYKQNF